MRNLLSATATNVSPSRHPTRRMAGMAANGTTTGTRTINSVSTTARITSSHHNSTPPTTTNAASTNRPKPGVDAAVSDARARLTANSPVPTVLAAVVHNWLTRSSARVARGRAATMAKTHAGATPRNARHNDDASPWRKE